MNVSQDEIEYEEEVVERHLLIELILERSRQIPQA